MENSAPLKKEVESAVKSEATTFNTLSDKMKCYVEDIDGNFLTSNTGWLQTDDTSELYLNVEDVREAVKQLKERFCDVKEYLNKDETVVDCANPNCSCRLIDEIFGSKLI